MDALPAFSIASGPGAPGVGAADEAALVPVLAEAITQAGGWLAFDRVMELALYHPVLGYYSARGTQIGASPASGSDFVTAPELSPLFGRTLARQVAQALQAADTQAIWEFGAGTGALAAQVLGELDLALGAERAATVRYHIIDLSGGLRQRQQQRLQPWNGRVQWHDRWPERLEGVVLGNEVLDAMPVRLLHRVNGRWHERGVVCRTDDAGRWHFDWHERPTEARPPLEPDGSHDYLSEIHPQAEAFVRSLAERWVRGVAFFIDYGFPEREYYHPQRSQGTLMCHQRHRSDADPLSAIGLKDITAHVNFTGVALAAQEAGCELLGYTSQGRFLLNAGLMDLAADASVAERAALAKLVNEHEMGELFKVIAFAPAGTAPGWLPSGFAAGDRSHTL